MARKPSRDREGGHVRQPDSTRLRVERIDMHGAWLEGNIVTAQRAPGDGQRETVRAEGQIGRDTLEAAS